MRGTRSTFWIGRRPCLLLNYGTSRTRSQYLCADYRSAWRRHEPDLIARVRIVASTEPMPIPSLIGSSRQGRLLAGAFLAAHDDPALRPIMEELLIERFVRPQAKSRSILKQKFETARNF